jgi:hypothetical protein
MRGDGQLGASSVSYLEEVVRELTALPTAAGGLTAIRASPFEWVGWLIDVGA